MRIGGAGFSVKHANFIENHGEATTADVVAVMVEGRKRVRGRFGIELEPEVQALGPVEFPPDWHRRERLRSQRVRKAAESRGLGPRGGTSARATRRPAACKAFWRPPFRRLGPARVAAVLLVAALLGGGWLWLRDSSLVAVRHVEITGSAAQIGPHPRRPDRRGPTMTTLSIFSALAPPDRCRLPLPGGQEHPSRNRLSPRAAHPGGRGASERDLTAGRSPHTGLQGRHGAPRVDREARAPGAPGPRTSGRHQGHGPRQPAGVRPYWRPRPPALAARAAGVLDTAVHGIVVNLRTGPTRFRNGELVAREVDRRHGSAG